MALFGKEETRALLILALTLALGILGFILVQRCERKEEAVQLSPEEIKAITELEQAAKADLAAQRESNAKSFIAQARLFPFDPNHADSLTLRRLGLRDWQVSNMLKYRRHGGTWHSAEDFKRLYGLSREDFALLKPYIRIAPEDRRKPYTPYETSYGTPKAEQPQYEHIEKYAEGTRIPLNQADTSQLKRIPGIGSHYARKIIDYRKRLGGFINPRQVEEIEGLPAGVSRWFVVEDNPQPKQLRINHASFTELVRHPYLEFEQVKDIANHIRQYGPLRSWNDLKLYKEFTDEDFRRLAPYFTFE